MNKKILITIVFISLIGFLCEPLFASALTTYTYDNFSNLKIGETNTVKIFIDTEGQEINVLEGKFKIIGPAKISNINTNGSIFSLWTEKPEISNNQEINFAGGIPGGVYGKDLRILNFNVSRIDKGQISIEPVDIVAYLNDGMGTKIENANLKIETDINGLGLTKILKSILIAVVLFTIINILRKIFKKENK